MTTYYFDMDGVIANFHKEPYKYTNAINREWIANLEPFMENVNLIDKIIIIVGSGKKCDYIREAGILVDDDKTNINQWIKAGYQGILLKAKGEKVIL